MRANAGYQAPFFQVEARSARVKGPGDEASRMSYVVCMSYVVGRAKRAPHWGVQSRFRVIYIYMLSVCRMSVVCQINCVGGITYGPRACSKSFFGG